MYVPMKDLSLLLSSLTHNRSSPFTRNRTFLKCLCRLFSTAYTVYSFIFSCIKHVNHLKHQQHSLLTNVELPACLSSLLYVRKILLNCLCLLFSTTYTVYSFICSCRTHVTPEKLPRHSQLTTG